jgi:LPXTG-motif cell wall-anchored protein
MQSPQTQPPDQEFAVYFRSILRRLVALGATALAGTAAALAFASPASAHLTTVVGNAVCDPATSEFVVTWTVSSHDTPRSATQYKLVEVLAAPATAVSWTPVTDAFQSISKNFVGTVRLPGNAARATLSVRAAWNNKFEEREPNTGTVEFGQACAAKPSASFATDCVGAVTVDLVNTDGIADAAFTVTGKNSFSQKVPVGAGKTEKLTVPAANSAEITVTEGSDDTLIATGKRAVPGSCGNLPVTGFQAGAAAAGAAGLVGAGAVLFVVARRRRIRFVA